MVNARECFRILSVFIFGGIFIVGGSAYSQTKAMTTDEMVGRSDIVAVGKVSSMRSEWNSDRSRVVTRVMVSVDRYLKGEQSQRSLVITVPGGEVDGVGELYSHSATFKPNEDVVVFAERDARGTLRVTGGSEGKLTVTEDARTGKHIVGESELLEVFTTRVHAAIKAQTEK
ncbi:MAG: hypothetical protein ABI623_06060 [bacterium]